MCLQRISLNLVKRNGEFVGKGYKRLPGSYVTDDKLTIPSWDKKEKKWSRNWMESGAKGKEKSNDGQEYVPGFHIFLNKEDADNYHYGAIGHTVEVEFKDVISVGTNEVAYKDNGTGDSYRTFGPCVVANKMRITNVNLEE